MRAMIITLFVTLVAFAPASSVFAYAGQSKPKVSNKVEEEKHNELMAEHYRKAREARAPKTVVGKTIERMKRDEYNRRMGLPTSKDREPSLDELFKEIFNDDRPDKPLTKVMDIIESGAGEKEQSLSTQDRSLYRAANRIYGKKPNSDDADGWMLEECDLLGHSAGTESFDHCLVELLEEAQQK